MAPTMLGITSNTSTKFVAVGDAAVTASVAMPSAAIAGRAAAVPVVESLVTAVSLSCRTYFGVAYLMHAGGCGGVCNGYGR